MVAHVKCGRAGRAPGARQALRPGRSSKGPRILDAAGASYFGCDLVAFQSVWSAVLSAVAMKPLHETLLKWTNRRIRSGPVDLKEDFPHLIGDRRETEPTSTVARAASVQRLRRTYRAADGRPRAVLAQACRLCRRR